MVSLSVLEITGEGKREKFEEENADFPVQIQSRLTDVADSGGNLGGPKTEVTKKREEENFHYFGAEMTTKTKQDTIVIYRNGRVPWESGYQKKLTFDFWIDKEFNYLYVFANKDVVKSFARRLNQTEFLKCQSVSFDLSRLTELEDHDSTRGSWEDTEGGIVTKEAKFGQAIDDAFDEGDYERITAVHIDYVYGTEDVYLTLNREGRISTQHNLDDQDMFAIYQDMKDVLVV